MSASKESGIFTKTLTPVSGTVSQLVKSINSLCDLFIYVLQRRKTTNIRLVEKKCIDAL